MKFIITPCLLLVFWATLCAQKKVLFLGNSYTYTNNLPEMLKQAALSTGDGIIYDSNAPGGHTLQQHSTNTTSLAKINAGGWDFVVLQEQSQIPSFPDASVELDMYPYAELLDSLIRQANPCAETVFYMTWGRKNGDASNCPAWPPVCTYAGMDSLIHLRYRNMADSNEAILSPVGALWRYLRANQPGIELYVSDGSHPSVEGTYAAACTFYTVLLRKNPELITFNSTLPAATAQTIRQAAKLVVYDSLAHWNVGSYDPDIQAQFSHTVTEGYVNFTNASSGAQTYLWDFGDGTTPSTDANPQHLYTAVGTYSVKLAAVSCAFADTATETVTIQSVGIEEEADPAHYSVFPNPVRDVLYLSHTDAYTEYGIYDTEGRKIKQGKITTAIPVHDFPKGVYTLVLSGSKKLSPKPLKFVKQ